MWELCIIPQMRQWRDSIMLLRNNIEKRHLHFDPWIHQHAIVSHHPPIMPSIYWTRIHQSASHNNLHPINCTIIISHPAHWRVRTTMRSPNWTRSSQSNFFLFTILPLALRAIFILHRCGCKAMGGGHRMVDGCFVRVASKVDVTLHSPYYFLHQIH